MKILNTMQSGHNFLHYVSMVIYLEVTNIAWISVGLILAISGYALYTLTQLSFWRIAIGLPLGLIGINIFIFKFYEFITVVFRLSVIKANCKLCQGSES